MIDINAGNLARIAVDKRGATQKITELASLINLLKRRKIRTVLEIGTARGGTLYVWCKIAQRDAVIISIDLPGGPFGGGYTLKDMQAYKKYKYKGQKLFFLRMNSQKENTKKQLLGILKGKKIDFLFIDGDHGYAGVKKDFQLYYPLVKRKGLIVFHDILLHPKVPHCKVYRFWNKIKYSYRYVEIIDKEDDRGWGQWGGIGILFKNGNV